MAILTIQFAMFFLPGKDDVQKAWGKFERNGKFATETEQGVVCPNGYAVKIPFGEPFAGAYVSCEKYDDYYVAIASKDLGLAEKLLLSKGLTYYDKSLKR